MNDSDAAERYYWKHQEAHAVTPEQTWLKDVVMACFCDGAAWQRDQDQAAKYREKMKREMRNEEKKRHPDDCF